LGAVSSAVLIARSSLSISLHLREDRLVGDVRRLHLQDLGGVGEELAGRHRVDLDLWRGLHVDTGIDGADHRLDGLTKARDRRDLEAGLDLVHGLVVGRARRSWCG
jgi:hypothetical protein